MKKVYILHKNGAPSHYVGLDYLLKEQGASLVHREFSVFGTFFKAVFKGNGKALKKQIVNFCFLASLLFSKNKKIVLGIAPFDAKLGSLLFLLKNHQVYYHSSWTCWDKTFHPKRKNNSPKVFEKWRFMLEEKTAHIFVVTQRVKNALLENYKIDPSKISVVYHSLDLSFPSQNNFNRAANSYISVGRIIPEKGIREMLDVFAARPTLKLTIVGSGSEENIVKEYAQKFENITFFGKTKNRQELFETMQKHQYLVLNSKKTATWEELFGLVIIEAMSQGLIVLSSNHSGPKEIINQNTGYLFEEGNLASTIDAVWQRAFPTEMSENAIEHSKKYLSKNIAKLWKPILQ